MRVTSRWRRGQGTYHQLHLQLHVPLGEVSLTILRQVRLATAPCHVDIRGGLRGLVVVSGAFLAAPLATGGGNLT